MNHVDPVFGISTVSDATRPWWKGAAIYQIYPRSFADSNGDGVGDLRGIIDHLDYVADLGVDAIWISPFFKSPQADFGYDVSDYRDIDPQYGTLADCDALIAAAHRLGLRVLVDMVWSHTSDQHAWFRESRASRSNPRADWYVWADPLPDGRPPNNWQSVFGGPAWTWDGRRRQYYLHNFLPQQPQLHVHRADVQEELLATARFWLDRGVDGFRMDALNFMMHDPALTDNPPAPDDGTLRTRPFDYQLHTFNQGHADIPAFLERLRGVFDEYDDRFTVAEVGGADSLREMKLFTANDRRLNSAYGFDFLYAPELSPAVVRKAIDNWGGAAGEGWPSWAFENHDAPRALSRWAEPDHRDAFARAKMLLLASLRGNIFLYYGEELGLPQVDIAFEDLRDPEAIANWPLTLSRDGARTPMPWASDAPQLGFTSGKPWLPVGPDHRVLAVDRQRGDPASILSFTREMLALRKAHDALLVGEQRWLATPEGIIAFERCHGEERLLCAVNLTTETIAWQTPNGWRPLVAVGDTRGRFGAYAGVIAIREPGSAD